MVNEAMVFFCTTKPRDIRDSYMKNALTINRRNKQIKVLPERTMEVAKNLFTLFTNFKKINMIRKRKYCQE
jgi:hypothetical protein